MDKLYQLQVILNDVIDWNLWASPVVSKATMKEMDLEGGMLMFSLMRKPEVVLRNFQRMRNLDAGADVGDLRDYVNNIVREVKDTLDADAAAADENKSGWRSRTIQQIRSSITSSPDEKLRSISNRIKPLLKYTDDNETDKFALQVEELGELVVSLRKNIDRDLNPTSMVMMQQLTQEVYMLITFFKQRQAISDPYVWSIVRDLQGITNSYSDQLAQAEGCIRKFPKKGCTIRPKITSLTDQVRSLRQNILTPILIGISEIRQFHITKETKSRIQKGFRISEETKSRIQKEALGELQVIVQEAIERDLDPTSTKMMENLAQNLKKLVKEEANTIMFRFGRISNLYYDAGLGDLVDHILKIVHDLKDNINSYLLIPRDDGSGAISLNTKLFTSFRKKVEFIMMNKLTPLLEDTSIPSDLPSDSSPTKKQFSTQIKAVKELKSILSSTVEKDKNPTFKVMMEGVDNELDKLKQQLDKMPDNSTQEAEHNIWNKVHDIQRIINLYSVQIPDDKGRLRCDIFTGTSSTTTSPNSMFPSLPRLVRYLRFHTMTCSPTQVTPDAFRDQVNALRELHYIISNAREEGLLPRRCALVELDGKVSVFRNIFKEVMKLRCEKANDDLETKARKLVNDMERIINSSLALMDKRGWTNIFCRSVNLRNFNGQVSIMADKLELLIDDAKTFLSDQVTISTIQEVGTAKEIKEAPKKQDKVIGFEEVTDTIINLILRDQQNRRSRRRDVIFITGLPGVGKTTLASEIFHHPEVNEALPGTVSWLANCTSTEFSDHILPSLEKSKKHLIILDGVSNKTWEQIKDVLPSWFKRGNNKVLLTMSGSKKLPNAELGEDKLTFFERLFKRYDDTSDLLISPYIKLNGMDQSRGWQFLHTQVYGEEDNDSCPDLERNGKFIVKHCGGIPRAILLIGRVLREQLSATERHTAAALRIWEEVAGKMDDYLFDPGCNLESMQDCMSMIYDNLDYSYRNCLLYMAMFPQNSEIPRWKLKCLFVAEGILQSCNVDISFGELCSLNLLMIRQGPDGSSSDTCYLNNLVRQFCRRKIASTEQKNMFHRIKGLPGGSPQKTTEKSCDHHLVLEKQKRSFPCFTDKSIIIRSITEAFNMPRVLEDNTVDFHKFQASPLHLRHITLSNDRLNVVPRTISMFRNMKTLVVKTFSRTLKMEASLQELPHLEIFHTNAAIILRKDRKVQVGESLESLRHLSPQSCSHLVMNGIVELRIRGELAEHLDSSFLEKAEDITSLYLVNDVYPKLTSEKPLPRLPPSYLFPPNLESLTLSSTYLDWEHMSTIAHLPLTTLKLKDYAFVGDHWDVTEINNFDGLKHLSIDGTNLKHWTTTSDRSFRKLETLLLKNCDKLEGLPLHKGNYKHLCLLELEDVSLAAVSSAKAFEKVWNETGNWCPLQLQIAEDDGISTKGPQFSIENCVIGGW